LDNNDFDVEFYVNPAYFGELGNLIHPAYQDRIFLKPLTQSLFEDRNSVKALPEAGGAVAINTWIAANDFYRIVRDNRQEIQGICYTMFKEISGKNGLEFPLKDRSEFIFDHPWHLGSNRMLDELGSPDLLFINSTPMSGQFSKSDEVLEPIYEYLKGRKVFVTKRSHGLPCTLDYGLNLLQIGQVAARARIVISLDTGPLCASVNGESVRNVQAWFVLTGKSNPEVVFNKVGERFSVSETALEVVEKLGKFENRKPEVSVLMSLYRGERYLEGHLRNFALQTCIGRVQLVICHNEPTEKELAVIRKFDSEHPGVIKHIIKAQRTTWSESMNECVRQADAGLLTIGNVDDLRFPDSILQQVEFLKEHPDYDVVHGNNQMVKEFGSSHGWRLVNAPFVNGHPELLTGMRFGPFFMWRKSAMEKHGYFDEQFRVSADFDLAMRLARRVKIGSLNTDLGAYLDEGIGLSTRNDGVEITERIAIKMRYGIKLTTEEQNAYRKEEVEKYNLTDVCWFGETKKLWMNHFLGHSVVSVNMSVVISSYNQLDSLKYALEALYFQTRPPHEVIVADDGSTDGTLEWLEEVSDRYPFPVYYTTRPHDGYRLASVNNEGARKTTGDRILFTNADVVHCPKSLEFHASMSEEVVGAGIVKCINPEWANHLKPEMLANFDYVYKLAGDFPSERTNLKFRGCDPNWCHVAVWGGNFSVSRAMLQKIGGFDAEYTGWGGEDADVSRRCVRNGGRIEWLDGSVVYHLDHRVRTYSYRQLGSVRYNS
jgi:GT2 family glycosyltransferase